MTASRDFSRTDRLPLTDPSGPPERETASVRRRMVATPRRAGPPSSRERLTAMIERLDREADPADRRTAGDGRGRVSWIRYAPSRRAVTGLLLVGIVGVLAAIVFLPRGGATNDVGVLVSGSVSPLPAPAAGADSASGVPGGAPGAGGPDVAVHVVGAVHRPGLVRLSASALVADAVEKAGGARKDAALDSVNLAAPLQSGQQIKVLTRDEAERAGESQGSGGPAPQAASSGASTGPGTTSGGTGTGAAPGTGTGGAINLNSATSEELQTLPRVGPATAQKIIDYRESHGGFRNVGELDAVPGIGEAMMSALEPLVTV